MVNGALCMLFGGANIINIWEFWCYKVEILREFTPGEWLIVSRLIDGRMAGVLTPDWFIKWPVSPPPPSPFDQDVFLCHMFSSCLSNQNKG